MPNENPDFTHDSKRKIAKAVRRTLSTPARTANHSRPAFPRGDGGGLAPPQYQYQVLTGVGNNRYGWDMIRAHPLLPS